MSVGSVCWGYCHNIPKTLPQQEQKYLDDLAKKLNGGDPADPAEAANGFANVRQFLQDTQQVGGPSGLGASGLGAVTPNQSAVQTSGLASAQNAPASTGASRVDITA